MISSDRISNMKVDLLFAPECSSREETVSSVNEILSELSPQTEIRITIVDSSQKAQDLKFPGSPTIRVNGEDLEPDVDKSMNFGLG